MYKWYNACVSSVSLNTSLSDIQEVTLTIPALLIL